MGDWVVVVTVHRSCVPYVSGYAGLGCNPLIGSVVLMLSGSLIKVALYRSLLHFVNGIEAVRHDITVIY